MSIFLYTSKSIHPHKPTLDILLDDVIKMISGLILMQDTTSKPRRIQSIDGARDFLLQVKNHFQVAYKLYERDTLPANKTTKFLAELKKAGENIDKALATL